MCRIFQSYFCFFYDGDMTSFTPNMDPFQYSNTSSGQHASSPNFEALFSMKDFSRKISSTLYFLLLDFSCLDNPDSDWQIFSMELSLLTGGSLNLRQSILSGVLRLIYKTDCTHPLSQADCVHFKCTLCILWYCCVSLRKAIAVQTKTEKSKTYFLFSKCLFEKCGAKWRKSLAAIHFVILNVSI